MGPTRKKNVLSTKIIKKSQKQAKEDTKVYTYM